MSGKSKNTVIITYAVIAVMYAVIFFAIPFERNATTWIAFSFGLVSIIAGVIVAFIAFDKGENLKSKVYGLPMFRLGYYYTAVQLILSIGLFIAELFIDLPSWISLIFSVLLLGVFIIGVVAVDNVRDIVEHQETKSVVNTQVMESFAREIGSIVRKSTDSDVTRELEKLAEQFKYSDPVSNDNTKNIDVKIGEKLGLLKEKINSDDCSMLIKEINALLADRNTICKANK